MIKVLEMNKSQQEWIIRFSFKCLLFNSIRIIPTNDIRATLSWFFASDHLVQVGVVQPQTFQEYQIAPLAFSVKNIQQST